MQVARFAILLKSDSNTNEYCDISNEYCEYSYQYCDISNNTYFEEHLHLERERESNHGATYLDEKYFQPTSLSIQFFVYIAFYICTFHFLFIFLINNLTVIYS